MLKTLFQWYCNLVTFGKFCKIYANSAEFKERVVALEKEARDLQLEVTKARLEAKRATGFYKALYEKEKAKRTGEK